MTAHVYLIFSRYGVYFQIQNLLPEITTNVMEYVGQTTLHGQGALVSAIQSRNPTERSGIQICWLVRLPFVRDHQYIERVQGVSNTDMTEMRNGWGMESITASIEPGAR